MNLKIIIGLIVGIVFLSALSVHLYRCKVEAEYSLVQVIDANTELKNSLNLRTKSCEISDSITSEYQAEKQVQQDKVQATISKIDALQSNIPKKAQPSGKLDEEIDIDSRLPDSIIVLLNQSCVPDKGDACVSP